MPEEQRWIPLESNPEVFNEWARAAGLIGDDLVFQDVYGLDEELLAMVGKPVKAVILLFPDYKDVQEKRRDEDVKIAHDGQPLLDQTIFWIKQTINNACGTMALIHALANTDVSLSPVKPLQKFIDQCRDKTPLERAKLLESTLLFNEIHESLARTGQSDVPADLYTDLHFVCFVQAPEADFRERAAAAAAAAHVDEQATSSEAAAVGENQRKSGMRLVELDGTRLGPVDRGESTDLLSDVAKHVKDVYFAGASSDKFNMIALAGPPPL